MLTRRVAAAALVVSLGVACWNWDGLVHSTTRYCATVDAELCDDFDDASLNSFWTSINGFYDGSASLDDASLLVDFVAGDASRATYLEVQLQPATNQYTFGFWLRMESITASDDAMRFFGVELDLPQSDDAGQYQLSFGGGPSSVTINEKTLITTLSPQTLDAGIDFPLGEWRYVFIVIGPNSGLVMNVSSPDASTHQASVTLALGDKLVTATRAHVRLGVFTSPPNVLWRARYDDFTATSQ